MNRTHFLCFILLALSFFQLDAQSYTFQGTITDQITNEPLPFVKVYVPNTTSGTVSDINGEYRLETISRPDSLVFQMVGFEDHVIPIDKKLGEGSITHFNVVLREIRPGPPPGIILPAYLVWDRKSYTGPMDIINRRAMNRFDPASIEASMNAIPGVRFDSRGVGGSRRLSVRGSLLRSPFGVRNLKTYMNGAPLTMADGATPMELVDVGLIRNMDVHKGPWGSEYGPGMGGVLFVNHLPGDIRGKIGGRAQ
ncbi:MAG: TonB-dependent receptor, partial [Bacteroidota bacterium]